MKLCLEYLIKAVPRRDESRCPIPRGCEQIVIKKHSTDQILGKSLSKELETMYMEDRDMVNKFGREEYIHEAER